VDRLLPGHSVVGATHGLAVEGDDLSWEHTGNRLHPTLKARLEVPGIESGKDPIEGVMGGNTVRQVQEASKPVSFRLSEQFDIVPTRHPQSPHRWRS
jgi:hypothetical protein